MSFVNNKHFLEELARVTLIHLLGYNDIFCAESPDIQSKQKDAGIEVISDVIDSDMAMQRMTEEIWGQEISNISKKRLQYLKKLGGTPYTDEDSRISGVHLGDDSFQSPQHLIASTKKKLKKLNENYSVFQENNLYIFVDTLILEICESYIYTLMEFTKEYQGKKGLTFDHLYLDQCYIFYDCNVRTKQFKKYMIDTECRKMLEEEATKLWQG